MVETLVAIAILTIAVIGPLGIIAQALHTSYYTRDQMTAYYLAQEAIEHVRNLRDNQSIKLTGEYINSTPSSDTWLTNVVGVATADTSTNTILNNNNLVANTYSMIIENGVYKFVPYNNAESLLIGNGIYGDKTSQPSTTSTFKREIYFKKVNSGGNNPPATPQEFLMVVNVYWKSGSYPSKLTLQEYFTNSASKVGL